MVDLHPISCKRAIHGTITVSGSKSVTNRALLLASLAHGQSEIFRPALCDDRTAMEAACRALGAGLVHGDDGRIAITGTGGLVRAAAGQRFDAKDAGTVARFLLPSLCLGAGPYVLEGSAQLAARPMAGLCAALREWGAELDQDHLPITVRGVKGEAQARIQVAGAESSQFLSGLLMASPYMAGLKEIMVNGPLTSASYVDLTLEAMAAFGNRPRREGGTFLVDKTPYRGTKFTVPADASSASYFFAAAAIARGPVTVEGITPDNAQGDLALLPLLEKMGCRVEWHETGVTVHGSERLRPIAATMISMPDAVPTLAAVAAFADGRSHLAGVASLRHKESDRLATLETGLRALGFHCTVGADAFMIEGRPGLLDGDAVEIETAHDHRMVMAFAVVGMRRPGVIVRHPQAVAKSQPEFFQLWEALIPHASP